MKIVHVQDYFQPQFGTQVTFIARKHAEMGHEVYVVTSDRYTLALYWDTPFYGTLGARIKGASFATEEEVCVYRLKSSFEIRKFWVWMSGLENKIRELKPDVVYGHGIGTITA